MATNKKTKKVSQSKSALLLGKSKADKLKAILFVAIALPIGFYVYKALAATSSTPSNKPPVLNASTTVSSSSQAGSSMWAMAFDVVQKDNQIQLAGLVLIVIFAAIVVFSIKFILDSIRMRKIH
jgi:hypothetical protein